MCSSFLFSINKKGNLDNYFSLDTLFKSKIR